MLRIDSLKTPRGDENHASFSQRIFSILISAICFLGLQTAQAGFPYWGYTPPPPGGTSLGGYSSLIISFQSTALDPPNFSFEGKYDDIPDVGRLCISGKVVGYFSDDPTAKAVLGARCRFLVLG